MGRRKTGETVRMSSKGQVVIPAKIRRELGLTTGRVLRLTTTTSPRQVVLSLPESEPEGLDAQLKRARAWKGPDLVEELHRLRQREREKEARRNERRGD